MGELGRRLGQPAELYRGLRPEALALALYVGAQVRSLSGTAPLIVTSTVRDQSYQDALVRRNREATRNYSLHTTGWAFDVLRDYRSRRQALAFQFVLDRLRTLNVIAWVREPRAIHITAADDAEVLLPLLERTRVRRALRSSSAAGALADARASYPARAARSVCSSASSALNARASTSRSRRGSAPPSLIRTPARRGRYTSNRGRSSAATHRRGDVLGREPTQAAGVRHARGELRPHEVRHHHGDLDARSPQLGARGLGETHHAVLGRGVGPQHGEAAAARERGHVDDVARASSGPSGASPPAVPWMTARRLRSSWRVDAVRALLHERR